MTFDEIYDWFMIEHISAEKVARAYKGIRTDDWIWRAVLALRHFTETLIRFKFQPEFRNAVERVIERYINANDASELCVLFGIDPDSDSAEILTDVVCNLKEHKSNAN